jgi:anti-sigma B factor antagonist
MRIDQEKIEDVLVLRVCEKQITSHEAPEMKTKILGFLIGDHEKVLLDLSQVSQMDSTGLGALLFALRQSDQHEKDLRICGIHSKVQFLVHVAHLEDVIESYQTVDEGVRAFMDERNES